MHHNFLYDIFWLKNQIVLTDYKLDVYVLFLNKLFNFQIKNVDVLLFISVANHFILNYDTEKPKLSMTSRACMAAYLPSFFQVK